uniref:CTLH domain-containing protein n=1 Tax=Aegilops tauschii subsp. strangulata TaxID=200361 RepID=A0A452YGK2_AEGTS
AGDGPAAPFAGELGLARRSRARLRQIRSPHRPSRLPIAALIPILLHHHRHLLIPIHLDLLVLLLAHPHPPGPSRARGRRRRRRPRAPPSSRPCRATRPPPPLSPLHKQRFVELVRRGTEVDREAALDCLRTALAPCALDAYPEAYEEFKHILLVLIYDQDDQSSPVVNEWSIKRRFELAGLLSSILRAHLQAYDPILSMSLRYLISIHKVFCSRQGVSSPISDLTERLLFEDRDPPAVTQECSVEAPPFDEVDVQALAHAVELTRQGAIDSLKFAKGDLYQAFQVLLPNKLSIKLFSYEYGYLCYHFHFKYLSKG